MQCGSLPTRNLGELRESARTLPSCALDQEPGGPGSVTAELHSSTNTEALHVRRMYKAGQDSRL